jgi:hypothetical protein
LQGQLDDIEKCRYEVVDKSDSSLQQLIDNIIELYLSTPLAGAKKASRLTVRAGNTRIDLNGRQIKALREVLTAGFKA